MLLALARAAILGFESRGTDDHILLSDSRFPHLEGQAAIFISPRNRVAQLYPQALDSLFVALYDSQSYGGGIRTRLHAGIVADRIENNSTQKSVSRASGRRETANCYTEKTEVIVIARQQR
jgi:hypothetical protein